MADKTADELSDDDKSLLMAAEHGHVDVVQYLVSHGAHLHTCDIEGQTPLHWASKAGHLDVVEYLVRQGAQVEGGNNKGWTPLHVATEQGNLVIVQYLVGQGAQVDGVGIRGITPLHLASLMGYLNVVQYLVSKGAQVKRAANIGATAIFFASGTGRLDVVEYLVSQGARVNMDTNKPSIEAPLHIASAHGHLSVAQYLVGQGAHVDGVNNKGETPLHYASNNGHLNVARYLVSQGAHLDRCDNDGITPLHLASRDGHLDVVKYLVGQGAQVEGGNNNGVTPLNYASRNGHVDVVEYLVGQGAHLERCNNDGWTPLLVASRLGHLDVVEYLVGQGAQIERGNNDGYTPLYCASMKGQLKVVQYLVSQGAQVEMTDAQGVTPLVAASQRNHLDVVQYLAGQGAQINRGTNEDACWTPLHVASQMGHLDVIRFLVGQGALVERGSKDGWTPLLVASGSGHLDVVEYLVSQGAQIDTCDNDGHTPLELASLTGHLNVVQYLKSEQAQRKEASPEVPASVSEAYTAMASMSLNAVTNNVAYQEEDEYSKALADEEAKRVTPPQDQESLEPHSDTTLGRGLNPKEADDTDNNEGIDDQLTSLTHDPGSNRDDIPFGGLSAPPEILARGPRARRAYAEAAQAGTKKVFRTRLMLVGQERVGKTSLKKTLTGQRFDQNEAITNGVETTNACGICIEVAKAGGKMWSIHKKGHGNEDTKEDEYSKAIADDIATRLIVTPSQNQESLEPHNDKTLSRGLGKKHKEDVHDPNTEGFVLDKVEAPKANKEDDNMPNHIASLVERMLKKQVHLKEIGTGSTDSAREESVSLSIWDFAGHDIYYTTHQVFLTWRAIYVIVFDLSRSLDSVVPPESRDKYYEMAKGGAKSELTCLEFINFWLCSIFAHAVAPSSVRNKDTSKTAQKSPPIFIVGTHRDSVQGNAKEKKEKIGSAFGKIRESIMERPFQCHVVPRYYAIENSLEDNDEELVELRKHIEKVAMKESYMGEEIPLRWLLFEEALAADSINFMSLDQTKKLTQPFGMESERELLTMLTFYHDLGYIVYYGGIEDKQSLLRDMVILNPQWLIDVFKQVITILDPAEMDGIVSDAWTTLRKHGILEDRLIQHMWQGFLEQKEALVKLMTKFDLVCEAPVERLQQEQHYGVDTEASNETEKVVKKRYYVPSRLTPHCSPEEIAQITSSTYFFVDFRGFLPDGLFHRLMTRAVRWMVERDGEPVNLYYRHISLMVDEEHHALIEMLPPHEATIKVTVFQGEVADSDDDDGDIQHPPASSAVKEVMDFVRSTLDDLILHWSRRIEYDVCFLCPKCSKKKLLQDCFKRKSLKCGEHKIRTAPIKSKFGMSEEGVESGNQSPAMPRRSNELVEASAMVQVDEEQTDTQNTEEEGKEDEGEEEKEKKEVTEDYIARESLPRETVPVVVNVKPIKMECCKKVGIEGGKLQLDSFGIELDIPPGAIDSTAPQDISLRVLTDTPNLSNIKDEMSVCFGVQCLAPDDLVLKLPVTYTIPHCAVITRYSSVEAVLYTGEGEYSPDAVVKERIMLSRSRTPSCIITKSELKLTMNHFSWANIKFRINNFFFREKKMCCQPFKEKNLALQKTPVILHAHLYDDIIGNSELVKSEEFEQEFIPAHVKQQVLIQTSEGDLKMTCYVKKTVIGGPTVVSFDRLKSGTRICEPFELDFPNQSDSVAVSLKVGQNNKLQVNFLFRLEERRQGPSPQDQGVPRNNLGITGATQGNTDFTSQRPSASTVVFIPPEGASAAVGEVSTSTAREVSDEMLNKLVRRIPSHNYDTLSERLDIEHTEARNILERYGNNYEKATRDCMAIWRNRSTRSVTDLHAVLIEAELGGLIDYCN